MTVCNRRNREFFLAFLRLIQDALKAHRLLKSFCQIAALALRRTIIWSPNMTWTCPEIIEICVGMEITSYESAEI
jgi:coenzyme PQQ precursor peptide PqqA